jgi:hypothetical protein
MDPVTIIATLQLVGTLFEYVNKTIENAKQNKAWTPEERAQVQAALDAIEGKTPKPSWWKTDSEVNA